MTDAIAYARVQRVFRKKSFIDQSRSKYLGCGVKEEQSQSLIINITNDTHRRCVDWTQVHQLHRLIVLVITLY